MPNNKVSKTIQTVGTVTALGASIAADVAMSTLLKTYMPPQTSKVKTIVMKLGIAAISATISEHVFDSINNKVSKFVDDVDREYEKTLNELREKANANVNVYVDINTNTEEETK